MNHNRTLIPLTIENVKLTFLMDTGASTSLIFKNARTEKLTSLIHKNGVLVKFPAIRQTAKATRIEELAFQTDDRFKFTLHNILVLGDPVLLERIAGDFDGIIGQEFFRQFTIEVNPLTEELKLYDQSVNLSNQYPLAHTLTSTDSSPHVVLSSKFPWERFSSRKRLLLDTGYPGGMVIWSKRHFRNVTTKTERERLGAQNAGVFLRMNIQFNRLLFRELPVFFGNSKPPTQTKTHGLIGAGLLVQYKHVYDFKRKKLLLMPLTTPDGTPLPISTAGIYTPNNEAFITKDYKPRVPNSPRIIINASQSVTYQ